MVKYTKIALGKVTEVPSSAQMVSIKRNSYWFVTDDNCILCVGKSGFQYNQHRSIAESVMEHYPFVGSIQFIPVVYIPVHTYDFEYEISSLMVK